MNPGQNTFLNLAPTFSHDTRSPKCKQHGQTCDIESRKAQRVRSAIVHGSVMMQTITAVNIFKAPLLPPPPPPPPSLPSLFSSSARSGALRLQNKAQVFSPHSAFLSAKHNMCKLYKQSGDRRRTQGEPLSSATTSPRVYSACQTAGPARFRTRWWFDAGGGEEEKIFGFPTAWTMDGG